VNGVDQDASGPTDVDDLEIAPLDELVDRAATNAECSAGAFDREQEHELAFVARTHLGGDLCESRRLLRRVWPSLAGRARGLGAGFVLAPQTDTSGRGAVIVRVSPP